MDAREYLARQGVSLDREEDRPNTLEELAWERARQAGAQRPRTGTPHDWEDWERYHDQLAGGADQLARKIDPTAHGHGARDAATPRDDDEGTGNGA
ncbi:hypothetical protein [Modicisalibacter sp. 'Wilcox']|uniref:hypothetical protein n=1 Tax=Modicisalibacter sp. 'Wilcox' TaxID=2679914 RepID=UPI0013D4F1E3|nr:hypothetical protein [Modicisalibacter sp. 'Wilcox']